MTKATKAGGRVPPLAPTERMVVALAAIASFRMNNGYSPTDREVGAILGISASAARERVRNLIVRGLVKRSKRARSMVITPSGMGVVMGGTT